MEGGNVQLQKLGELICGPSSEGHNKHVLNMACTLTAVSSSFAGRWDHSFISLTQQYLLNVYYVPSIVLGWLIRKTRSREILANSSPKPAICSGHLCHSPCLLPSPQPPYPNTKYWHSILNVSKPLYFFPSSLFFLGLGHHVLFLGFLQQPLNWFSCFQT